MSKLLETILSFFAKLTLRRNKPIIIGITGSVGKSSTKEAIGLVLSQKFSVRISPGNLNSQIGLPLAVLGFSRAGGFNRNLATAFSWIKILILGFFKIFQSNYPKFLVLEMGTDRPGDIARLIRILGHLDVAVITDIGISHLEYFPSHADLIKEKLSLLDGLKEKGTAVLNADNDFIRSSYSKIELNAMTYGFTNGDLQGSDLAITQRNDQIGLSFKLNFKGNRVPVFIPKALGKPIAYSSLAATAVGLVFGLNLVEISQALERYKAPLGRLNLISGINNSTILDDTYNSAPSSTAAAIEVLSQMQAARRVAVLGHMAELGSQTESGHRQVGAKLVEANVNLVLLVGEKTKFIQDELEQRKFSGRSFWFNDTNQLITSLKSHILPGDIILVKGSQSARMEKVVKEIMLEPAKASDLLVRQSKQWIN